MYVGMLKKVNWMMVVRINDVRNMLAQVTKIHNNVFKLFFVT